jgi:hypothetical protein
MEDKGINNLSEIPSKAVTMGSNQLEVALAHYKTVLTSLEQAATKPAAGDVLAVLTARDVLQDSLNDLSVPPESQVILQIFDLDSRLRAQAKTITATVDLAASRATLNPPEKSWWWFIEPPLHAFDRLDWLWNTFSVAALTGSFSLAIYISSCFLAGGADFFGTLAVSTQAVLTFLKAQGTFTKGGRQGLQHLLSRLNLPKYWWREVELGISGVLLAGLLAFYSALPTIGVSYRKSGIKNFDAGRLASAEGDFMRALHLNPNDVETNFYLGLVYEDLQQLDKAKEQYQIAVLGGNQDAYNNLARLYILNKKYSNAASLIQRLRLQGIDPKDTDLNYALYKNLGWLQLEQGQIASAKANLQLAIDTAPENAGAQCLMAQVLDKLQLQQKALSHWELCLAYASGLTPEEANWIGLARERLKHSIATSKQPPANNQP